MSRAYIGMGGNVASWAGRPEATLLAARERLSALGPLAASSSLYSTTPVGYADQPRFVNAVVAIETALTARQLLTALMELEHEFGRDRSASFHNGPRPLDLDILLYGESQIHEPDLIVPHPRLGERAFVLVPLQQIAPALVIPGLGRPVSALLENLPPADDTNPPVLPLAYDGWRPLIALSDAD